MSISRIVQELMSITTEQLLADENLKKKHGVDQDLGLDFANSAGQSYLAEAMFKEDSLAAYLETLDVKTLECLVLVMYMGRDVTSLDEVGGFDKWGDSLLNLGFKGNKPKCIESISGKPLGLNAYFSKAVELVGELDSFLMRHKSFSS